MTRSITNAVTGETVIVPLTPEEEAAHVIGRAESQAKADEKAAQQARKDAFKANNDNKPVTIGDLREILEDAGVI